MKQGTVRKLSAENKEPLAEQASAPPGGKLLLVDHDVKDLECYSEILRHRGYEVTACTSHVKAARLLERGGFDFIVTSQGAWALEGLCVLSLAKEINRNTPVLVLATSADMDCYLQAMQLGAVDYFEKPFPAEELLRIVGVHLRPAA
jgi:DNA-binding NtrC family response regulator